MHPNEQRPKPSVADNPGSSLLVHSIFHTIQGEGPFSGQRAVFIRLGGCNIQCPGCDTEYSEGSQSVSVTAIVAQVHKLADRGELCVITGGEPLRQNITVLCDLLLHDGFRVQIETNGTLPPPPALNSRVYVVCSPKAGGVNSRLTRSIGAYKYVLEHDNVDDSDGLPTSILGKPIAPARPHNGWIGPIYLSPCDAQDSVTNKLNTQAAVASCLRYGYILNLQIHKLVNLP